jgi:hypothetical protein
MLDGKRIEEFWSHWNHQPNSTQEFVRFRVRVIEVSKRLWGSHFQHSLDLREKFALSSGTEMSHSQYFPQSGLNDLLSEAKTEFDIADALQHLLGALEDLSPYSFDHCCSEIRKAIDLSPGVMIRLVRYGSTAMICPMGVELLDRQVVAENLVWLSKYPNVLKHFETTLRLYATKEPTNYRNMLDSLRFTLEQIVQIVLKNKRTLENQKEEFLAWLKECGVHTQIRNMYHTLLFGGFTQYQNDAVKHRDDEYTVPEVEFMLYATGTFLRLIQRLLEQERGTK